MCTEETQTAAAAAAQTQEKAVHEAARGAAGYRLDPRTESTASMMGIASGESQKPMPEQDESESARIDRLETAREEAISEARKYERLRAFTQSLGRGERGYDFDAREALKATGDPAGKPWPAVAKSTVHKPHLPLQEFARSMCTMAKIEAELAVHRANKRRAEKLERLAVLIEKYPYVMELMDLVWDLDL